VESRLIIAVDFNGVIHDHRDGVRGFCEPGSPAIPGAIDWLSSMCDTFDVFLVSASFAKADYILAAKKWLAVQGIPLAWSIPQYPGRSRLTLTPFKPVSLIFLDDRGVCFRGTFPTVNEIKSFKPWNR